MQNPVGMGFGQSFRHELYRARDLVMTDLMFDIREGSPLDQFHRKKLAGRTFPRIINPHNVRMT